MSMFRSMLESRTHFPIALVARAAAASGLAMGVPYALSGLLVPVAAATGWPRSTVALGFGVGLLATTVAALAGGALIDRLSDARALLVLGGVATALGLALAALAGGPLAFALLYGLFTGTGSGLLTIVAFVPIAGVRERTGVAYGLAFAGGGAGTALGVPLAALLAQTAGWRVAVAALSVLVLAVTAVLARAELPNPVALSGDDGRRLSPLRLFGLLVAVALFAFADEVGFEHTVPLLASAGLGAGEASVAGTLLALGFATGVVAGGHLSDRLGSLPLLLAGGGLVCVSLVALGTLVAPFVSAAVFGASLGAIVAARWAWSAGVFPRRWAGRVAGLVQVAYAIGGAPVGYVGGRVYEATGSYEPLFIVASAAVVAWIAVIATTVRPDVPASAGRQVARYAAAVRAR